MQTIFKGLAIAVTFTLPVCEQNLSNAIVTQGEFLGFWFGRK